jgi:DNA-binding MarR family transcriptional regulator
MAEFYRAQHIDFEPGNFPLVHYLSTQTSTDIGTAARALGISQAAVSQKSAVLANAGLVTLKSSAKDRRKSSMALTTKGKTLVKQLAPTLKIIEKTIAQQLGKHASPLMSALVCLEGSIHNGTLRTQLHQKTSRRKS